MCRPDYYRIEYEINPWMSRRRQVRSQAAFRQWEELHRVLTQTVGARVELLEPVPGLPDLVFTANGGYVAGRRFIRANFRYNQRAPEAPLFAAWFGQRGYQVLTLPRGYYFEGEGDLLPCGPRLFGGYHYRTDVQAHRIIGELLGQEVISLELADPYFYHLDTCFCPLPDGAALYYPPAFVAASRRLIEQHIARPIEVSAEDAHRFGCNSVVVGRQVVVNAGCEKLRRDLEALGYAVHEVELSEFLKAGGAAKCLALRLGWEDEPGRTPS